jgi:hypothetical protein
VSTAAADPFDTARIRRHVLEGWAASAARFREDANAEEDLARGSYRDRVVVELAQNASDAASRAGVAGRLSLRLDGDVLVASNTGAPLDAAGAESLSTLRASAKREDAGATGRFGVGFAAVLALTDDPVVASTTGALRWSAADAAQLVAGLPPLAEELLRRGGHVPVLRLPFASDAAPETGWETTVRLPLRDAAAAALARRVLAEADDALLLALPGLAEITVRVDGGTRVVTDDGRWHAVRRSGSLDPALLLDRPVEERSRPGWSVTWARPVAAQPVPPTLHAPTPTDEPLDLPALLIASFPLDPGRRHVAPGPLTDFLVAQAAAAYAVLAVEAEDPLALVPGPMGVGRLDSELRAAVLAALREAPLLHSVSGERVHPRDAVAVPGPGRAAREVLGQVLPGLVEDSPALARLGVRRLELADVVDQLSALDRPPTWWRALYDALAEPGRPGVLDALGALSVPLADGRVVRGPRGLLVAGEEGLPAGLEVLGLRVVHPAAAHPLLLRLGATEATARTVLDQPEIRAAVADMWDAETPSVVADAVLALVAASALRPGELDWLGDLVLVDDRGEDAPARELVVPGSVVDRVADHDLVGRPDPALLQRWGVEVLAAAGVLDRFGLVVDHDVLLDPTVDEDPHGLDDEATWVREVVGRALGSDAAAVAPELVAVRDLDLVRDDAWDELLARLATDRALRAAVVEPTLVVADDGRRVAVASYAGWWLGRHARLDGRPPSEGSTGPDLAGLYEPVHSALDAQFLAAVGVRTSLAALLAAPGGADDLLDRLCDPRRTVTDATLRRCYTALARIDPEGVSPPDRLRVAPDLVVDASQALVLDSPAHLQLPWPTTPLVVPLDVAADLAAVLDVATTSARVEVAALAGGTRQPTPLPAQSFVAGVATSWVEHDDLRVAGHPVQWWVAADGTVHACTLDGLARGLAWAAGRWSDRLLLGAVLDDPSRLDELRAEVALEWRDQDG